MSEITLTASAIEKIKQEFEKRAIPNLHIRLGVKGGGCNGMSYVFEYETIEKREKDVEFNFDGIVVFVDPKSLKLLMGTTIDYQSSLMKQGFVLNNPNVKNTCGCKKSFSV
jgi:iron-sulfur cluster assembly protein